MGVGKSSMLRKALEPYRLWREIPVVLDRSQETDMTMLLWDILRGPGDAREGLSLEETIRLTLERAAALDDPLIVNIMNAHWTDDQAAGTIQRICTLLRDAPVLIVMSARPTPRSAAGRLAGFARNSPNASYIRLDPFHHADTKAQLPGTGPRWARGLRRSTSSSPSEESCPRQRRADQQNRPPATEQLGRIPRRVRTGSHR